MRLNGNNLRVGREFVYPRSTISAGSVMQMELNHRLNEKARMMEREAWAATEETNSSH